ncbi:MAG: GNAT family N-acetyltransferase [Saprospiraceae bacterium]|nr:GNAT family N-acetyltransferase [Saprospiraceae bacterium]
MEVRELKISEIELVVDYFLNSTPEYMAGMGVDYNKLPKREEWIQLIEADFNREIKERELYYLLWLIDGKAVGHSNINKIQYGESAFMHLHLWKPEIRRKGIGSELIKASIPYYFNTFELKELHCYAYHLNPAPHKTLEKVGFEFVKESECVPGWINYYQKVFFWKMSKKRFEEIYKLKK